MISRELLLEQERMDKAKWERERGEKERQIELDRERFERERGERESERGTRERI